MSNFMRKVKRSGINRKQERKMLKQIIANQAEMEQMESIMKMYENSTGETCTSYQQAVDYFLEDKEATEVQLTDEVKITDEVSVDSDDSETETKD